MKRVFSLWAYVAVLMLALPVAALAAKDMSAKEVAAELQKDGTEWIIIDVRTPAEFAEGHIKDANNVDVASADFEEILTPLELDDYYVVYCRTGSRSTKAVEKMEKMGFKNVVHMKDGIEGWKKATLPIVPLSEE